MEDTHTEADAPGSATPAGATPADSAREHQSPIDEAKAMAKKVLGMITGRTGS